MSPSIASIAFGLLIWWLFQRDRAMRPGCSRALWIPVLWIAVIGSRPISSWFGYQGSVDTSIEGNPYERLYYLALIVAAFLVLRRRQISWRTLIAQNKWLAVFFIYLGISVLWSDDPFVSFKRWTKDIGNIFMVVIILTEQNPVEALKSVVFRCSSLWIPLSVLFIKYYANIGRYYDRWTWQYMYGGVTTDKNTLGMSLFLCGTGLCWSLLDLWNRRAENKKDVFAHLLLLVMCPWLWFTINSATSLASTILAVGILFGMRVRAIPAAFQRIGLGGVLTAFVAILLLALIINPIQMVANSLGRNATLTGRTPIWREVLKVDDSPLVGTGYYSFWQGDRAAKISKDLGFSFQLQEAHNGYLEVYLNSGLIGLAILLALLGSSVRRLWNRIISGDSFDVFRFAVLVAGMIYNVTESAFGFLVLVWIAILLVILEYRPLWTMVPRQEPKSLSERDDEDERVATSIATL